MIAVDHYRNGVPPLRTPVADAEAIAEVLEADHGFETLLVTEDDATLEGLRGCLARLRLELSSEDRVFVYIAGHGVAADGDAGPEGYVLPSDAVNGDLASFLPMVELHQLLSRLPCRHLLLMLDCCFAGAFRWSSGRDLRAPPRQLHAERYSWFVRDPAWQVIASAAHDQKAMDIVAGEPVGQRDTAGQRHSPFAAALLDGLAGAADMRLAGQPSGDGVITATELYLYLRERLEPEPGALRLQQTPSLWPLAKHDKGEFVFLAPGRALDLPAAPPLSAGLNPWRGLLPYGEDDTDLFFGRARAADGLAERLSTAPFVAVVGPSGSGKSSLVAAGALPRLLSRPNPPRVVAFRPGEFPLQAFALAVNGTASEGVGTDAARTALAAAVGDGSRILLFVDQLEELVTTAIGDDPFGTFAGLLSWAATTYPQQVRICVSLRSDFEGLILPRIVGDGWREARFLVPPMTQDELRRCIEGPASARVMRFESDALVDDLINELVVTPSPLPLLSFVLSETYMQAVTRGDGDRCLRRADYDRLEGVAGALQHRANEEYDRDTSLQPAFERVLLRTVSLDGGEPARRRIDQSELVFDDPEETARAEQVVTRLTEARLLVTDQLGGTPLVEPAHEAFIRGWDRMAEWIRRVRPSLGLARAFGADAVLWARDGRPRAQLWHHDPRLALVEALAADNIQGPLKLNAVEAGFLRASLLQRRKDRFRRIALVSGAAGFALVAAFVVVLLNGQVKQRATTATLLSRTSEITSRLDGFRQLDGLMAALDAADLSRKTFGQMSPEIRGSFIRALTRARERDRWGAATFQNEDPVVTPRGDEVLTTSQPDGPGPLYVVAKAWTLAAPHRSRDIAVQGQVEGVAHCSNGACLVVQHPDRTDVLDLQGAILWRLPANTPATTVDSDGAEVLVTADRSGQLLALRQGRPFKIGRVPAPVQHVRVSVDRRRVLVLTERSAYLGDLVVGGLRRLDVPQGLSADDIAFAPDGSYVLYSSGPGEVVRYALDGSEPQLAIRAGRQRVGQIAISRDGGQFAYTSETEGATYVVDQVAGLRFSGPLYGGATPSLAFTPNGSELVEIGHLDRAFKVFDLAHPALPGRQVALDRNLTATTICDQGRAIVWGDQTGRVGVLSISGKRLSEGRPHQDYVERLLCLGGNRVVSAGRDGHVRLWDGMDPARGRTLGPADVQFRDIALSPDGKALLSNSGKWVWRLEFDGAAKRLFKAPLDDINRIAVSRGGVLALGSSGAGLIVFYDAQGRRMTEPFRAHLGAIMALAFSPWSETLASGGTIGNTNLLSMSLWNTKGQQLQSVTAHPTITSAVAFDATDRLIVSGGFDGAVRLWDENLMQVGPDLVHIGEIVAGVAVAPDRPLFVLAGSDGAVSIMDLSDEALMQHACARLSGHPRLLHPSSELDRRVSAVCKAQLAKAPQ